jgi:uncharacterized protein (TIGR03437 family)
MPLERLALALVAVVAVLTPAPLTASGAPSYSINSIVNSATQTPGPLSPNALVTIYGTDLSFNTNYASPANSYAASLPNTLSGVSVVVGGLLANMIYVSPTQINFVVPYLLYQIAPGQATLFVGRDAVAGPVITVQIDPAAPSPFQWNGNYAIAIHLDGSLLTPAKPAKAGEIVILYVAGLGRVAPDISSGRIASAAVSLVPAAQFQVVLAGTPLAPQNVLYAGLAPGYAGLYQINLKLPDPLPAANDIKVVAYGQASPGNILLATAPPAPALAAN